MITVQMTKEQAALLSNVLTFRVIHTRPGEVPYNSDVVDQLKQVNRAIGKEMGWV